MKPYNPFYIILIAFTAAIGGFLLGYDGSVVSGAAPFYKEVFGLKDGSFLFGFSVSGLIWGCIFGNLFAGPLSDRIGRKYTLMISALLFVTSALITAWAGSISIFILGRIIGGVGVGFAILVAPVYIGEVAPPKKRGWLVSFNQLLIVIGLSSAYFVNYFILQIVENPLTNWRWMLGVEAFPAVLYFLLILFIPESPRWLIMKNQVEKAKDIMVKIGGEKHAENEYRNIIKTLNNYKKDNIYTQAKEFFSKKMKMILIIGFGLAVFQQVSGINSVLYYAPMIFESAGSGRDAAFFQAIAVGVVFLLMTIISMLLIDRVGRKPLLYVGVSIMAGSLLLTGITFKKAEYYISGNQIENVADEIFKKALWEEAKINFPDLINYESIDIQSKFAEITIKNRSAIKLDLSNMAVQKYISEKEVFIQNLAAIEGQVFPNELLYNEAIKLFAEKDGNLKAEPYISFMLKEGIHINAKLVLFSILGFIAGFSLSLGPVMWVMFSEIFPNRIRGLAISIVGTVNSFTSFIVATLFPVQLNIFGSSNTFFIYSGFMFLCLLFIWKYIIETKNRSLEELEFQLVK